MSCQVCVRVYWSVDCIIYIEQWTVSFILNSGLYHLYWTVDCIIYIEQWTVSFILNSGLYHLYWTVDCILYIEQWIVSFVLNSGLYHLYWTVDCIICFEQWIVSFIQASWKYINYPICYQHHGKQCRPRSNTADCGICSGSIVLNRALYQNILIKENAQLTSLEWKWTCPNWKDRRVH